MFRIQLLACLLLIIGSALAALAQNLVQNPSVNSCRGLTPASYTLSTTSGDYGCGRDNDLADWYQQGGTSILTQSLTLITGHQYQLSFQIGFRAGTTAICLAGSNTLTLTAGVGGVTADPATYCSAGGQFVTYTGTAIATADANGVQIKLSSSAAYTYVTGVSVVDMGIAPTMKARARRASRQPGVAEKPYWAALRR